MNASGFLNRLINYEKIPGYDYDLDGFRRFLANFNNPHYQIPNVIHVAGTKGKGSVAALLRSCLSACGYRVGSFTSPHLSSVHERIQVGDYQIPESDLNAYIKQIKPYIKKEQRARTYFEVLTTIAFLYFIDLQTEFNIFETGLGGRLDSTSVVKPIITVITRIGYDHQNLLGFNLPEIAKEKAGIIKSGIPLILARQRPSAAQVLERTARKKGAPFVYSDAYHTIRVLNVDIRGTKVHVVGRLGDFTLCLPLIGYHHAENLSIALAILCELRDLGSRLPLKNIIRGISHTALRGRFDIVSHRPLIIFDCAHNRDSYEALFRTIQDLKINNFNLVFGTSEGKNFDYCTRHIVPCAREIILVRADHPRAIEPLLLASQMRSSNKHITIVPAMKRALEYIQNPPCSKHTTIITGSFYLWQSEWCCEE